MKRKESPCKLTRLVLFLFIVMIVSISGCSNSEKTSSQSEKLDMQANAEYKEEISGIPTISILVDLPTEVVYSPDALTKTLSRMPGYGKDFALLVEMLPSSGQERDIAATRVRTEIMAGKGPDLFLCAQKMCGVNAGPNYEPFFRFPVSAMSNHFFLPLDDFINKSEYIDWASLQTVVMDTGRNDEGQQIIPLTYTFEAVLFDNSYTPNTQFPMTWEQMAEDPDPNIRVATQGLIYNVIGNLADYSKDVLTFSENELLSWVTKQYETMQSIPVDVRSTPRVVFDRQVLIDNNYSLKGEQEYTIIPVYNTSGGVTANVTTFVAINRNARRPDEAFRIIEYLLDPEVQQTSALFQDRMEGLPVYTGTGNSDTPQKSYWQMNEVNYKAVTAAQEQINVVNYPGPLEACVWKVVWFDEEERKKSVHEQYVLMQMLLAES